jgi:2-polyprenyl-3-methyl-5-hydroxy-6-metoxy-1,4-benzoquinol methylase
VKNLLEVGCGTGNLLATLSRDFAATRFTGAEAHASVLVTAAQRAVGVKFLQVDARRIPYRDEFDVIGAFDVIEHVEEDQQILCEMFAACRPGGGILVTVPHRRRYSRRDLLRKIGAAGFERAWATSFVTLLLLPMLVSRLAQRTRRRFETSRELKPGRMANRLLEAVMSLERRLIVAGFSLPAGGSLLAVAYKPAGSG